MVNVADGCGSSILGYPRIGPHRELEYALEGYWRGTHSRAGLLPVAPRHPPRRWCSFPRETRSCTPVTKLGQGRVEWEDYCKLWDNGTANVSLGYRWWNCSSAVANCVTAWEDPSLGAGTFGLMSVFRSTSNNGVTHLLDVHVRLNPDPQGNGIAGGTTENAVQARKTTCHELGHALGLAHISDTTSCMPQGAALDESQNPPVQLISSVPNAHDFDTIFQQHNHTH